ncbi:SAM-dependent methyltransferase [Bradyrhizobium sp. SSBR45G]|uniref:class I SAM-dependent methyltransferase n=1 Tax=unclassified Bradyrhizobium TaxID=2631580 RepID=UPI0023429671|nr:MULTISPECIES: class I SAM-dependent methyltransferase [unclassified Bradyrhizobium]GLH77632.1 SAM-dependent methyltransferase [Bradyrhizobium sp. SSBR45G]GLH84869.1 SAM-dependent methyltransferase [Bradyrhizobium sp. SSBR45R]
MMDKAEFDRFADAYDAQHRSNVAVTGEGPEYFAEYKIRLLRKIVDRSQLEVSQICDFGAGIGNSIPFFRRYFPDAALTSSDVSERSLALARQRHPGSGESLLIETDRIPSDSNRFDVVFSACVFHHIAHDEHVGWLRELHRITRPGGLIAVFEHNPLNPLTVRAVNTCPFDENAELIFPRTLTRRLQASGWSSPHIQYSLFFPRALARLRPLEDVLRWLPLGAQYVALARKA